MSPWPVGAWVRGRRRGGGVSRLYRCISGATACADRGGQRYPAYRGRADGRAHACTAALLVPVNFVGGLLASVAAADRLGWAPEARALEIGAGVGTLTRFAPDLVGGGAPITQGTLNGAEAIAMLPLLFLLRLALAAASYSAGTADRGSAGLHSGEAKQRPGRCVSGLIACGDE
jgi:H+/Cl- antiporter ClcA